jgi:Protein of unknown function (DUF3155)
LARRRKRKSRRRQEGRRILECVPQFSIDCGEDKPVTAARKFIHTEGVLPPALLLVKRNEHTTDRYFWAEKGLFGAQYVEENHFLFPSLRQMEEDVDVDADLDGDEFEDDEEEEEEDADELTPVGAF